MVFPNILCIKIRSLFIIVELVKFNNNNLSLGKYGRMRMIYRKDNKNSIM